MEKTRERRRRRRCARGCTLREAADLPEVVLVVGVVGVDELTLPPAADESLELHRRHVARPVAVHPVEHRLHLPAALRVTPTRGWIETRDSNTGWYMLHMYGKWTYGIKKFGAWATSVARAR